MNNSEEIVLAFCDSEEEYVVLMTEFMERQKNLPWSVHTYTDPAKLMEKEQGADILLVAESVYCEEFKELQPKRLIILNESGIIRNRSLRYVNKYQQADQVLREILAIYLEIATKVLPKLGVNEKTDFIGFFSPTRRSLQTTFALTMAQILAKNHRTLYLNFEYFTGHQELLADFQTRDLADLLYFLNAERDKFSLRMQSMVKQVGDLNYIPPMKYGQNLLGITAKEWMMFLKRIQEMGEYEFVVMDLSECMQGLFDILRICKRVYTVMAQEHCSVDKMLQFEKVLEQYSYEDILEKTVKCRLPRFRHLPEDIELFTRGDLAEYVQEQLEELMGEPDLGGKRVNETGTDQKYETGDP